MKKLLGILIILFLIIIFSIYALKINKQNSKRVLENYNKEYEIYLNKTIYGTDLATIINKAINQNEKEQIQKNEKNYYIENGENSIKIEIKMTITDKTYPMEEIYNKDTAEFVKHFSTEEFKCTEIQYHKKTGKVRKMIFEEQSKET